MTAQKAHVQTVALCVCLCRDVIYKVILKLNHLTLKHSSDPSHGYTHTPQPPHSMNYKINTALSNKQQKENSNFHFKTLSMTWEKQERPSGQKRKLRAKTKGNRKRKRKKGFYLNFTNASFTTRLSISGRTHRTCSCRSFSHMYHCLANFHRQNTVILIRIQVIGNFARGWKFSPHTFRNGFNSAALTEKAV